MPQGLSYADAVRLLGGSGPLAKAVDNLLGGALSLATAGGSDLALSLFDAKAEVVRLGGLVTAQINDSVRGLGRHDRSERLQAAHAVLVVTAFFEALDTCLTEAAVEAPGFTRDDQVLLAVARTEGTLVSRLVTGRIPAPAPDRPYADLLVRLQDWYAGVGARVDHHIAGLAVGENADDRARRALTKLLGSRLPGDAVARYDALHRRLAEEIPEFAIWADRLETRAAAHGLERLEATLLRVTSGRDPGRHRAALARAYRAALVRPVLGGDAGDLVLPTLGDAYVDPLFRVKAAGPGARPADERWWDTEVRADLAGFLAAYLTTTRATEAPLLLLGQPGAGKSSLTRILAARLPASDFFAARVALREVPADAEIQDQVELALRAEIGETVSWAELAGESGGALPVVLLDGFDELLQATGLHQSDYLQRVAAFQQREAALGRPVAVMVTSRVAVADRARLPAGSLAVRLEPFDDAQIERWLTGWNDAIADHLAATGRRPLGLDELRRLPDLAAQPLLLVMLALYYATGNALRDDPATLDGGRLYERLLAEFAAREVRRQHAGRPDAALPELVEAELLRLSVVAFAMFHRLRLWVTEAELDDDLTGLGLTASRPARTEGFRASLTAGQEMVGRFFFIQRAQAVRDDRMLQTYEFLHATFGEYLVARLIVQALRDTAAREAAGTLALRLGPAPEDDLLQSLLGFTPLSARATVLPFIAGLLDAPDRDRLRAWLVGRTAQAMTRPHHVPRRYRPVDKRIDHWMATFSFNLVLLTVACGGELRASDLFTRTDDPADWMRNAALQWRAAVPGSMWLEAMSTLAIRREWRGGRRDIVLTAGDPDFAADIRWSSRETRAASRASWEIGATYGGDFELDAALNSMLVSNDLSDDLMLHALEPLRRRMPQALTLLVIHGPESTESLAHTLVRLWVTSAHTRSAAELADVYDSVVIALRHRAWLTDEQVGGATGSAVILLLQALRADADRLPPDKVVRLVLDLGPADFRPGTRAAELAAQCLLTGRVRDADLFFTTLVVLLDHHLAELDDHLIIRAFHALIDTADTSDTMIRQLIERLDGIADGQRTAAVEAADPLLAVRFSAFR